MNSGFLIATLLLIIILIFNFSIPKVYRKPFQRLLLIFLILIIISAAALPSYIALPLANIFKINNPSDFVLYLLIILILAILNRLYKEIRELNNKLNKIMQMNTIKDYFKENKS
tara:strand:- start:148 stop:489 length:342 start_codon:yes stop_codon:yes gene_type:complete